MRGRRGAGGEVRRPPGALGRDDHPAPDHGILAQLRHAARPGAPSSSGRGSRASSERQRVGDGPSPRRAPRRPPRRSASDTPAARASSSAAGRSARPRRPSGVPPRPRPGLWPDADGEAEASGCGDRCRCTSARGRRGRPVRRRWTPDAPSATPSRAISASPRVIRAARALSPSPRLSDSPVAIGHHVLERAAPSRRRRRRGSCTAEAPAWRAAAGSRRPASASAEATTRAAGSPPATSRAKEGPDSTATGRPGSTPASTWDIRGLARSIPLVRGHQGGARRHRRRQPEQRGLGEVRRHRDDDEPGALGSASAGSAVTDTPAGSATARGGSARSRAPPAIAAARCGSRAHRGHAAPRRPRWTASAVPQLPPPTTATRGGRRSTSVLTRRAVRWPRRGSVPPKEPPDVLPVTPDDDGGDGQRGGDRGPRIAEQAAAAGSWPPPAASRATRARGPGDAPQNTRAAGSTAHGVQREERAEAGRHALAAAEAEDTPASSCRRRPAPLPRRGPPRPRGRSRPPRRPPA